MFSRLLPIKLGAQYARARKNPDPLNLIDHIALVDAKLMVLLERLKRAEYLEQPDAAAAAAADAAAWTLIGEQLDRRRKLTAVEVRRRRMASDVLDRTKALSMMGFIAGSIARHVSNPDEKRRIVDDIRMLMGQPAPDPDLDDLEDALADASPKPPSDVH